MGKEKSAAFETAYHAQKIFELCLRRLKNKDKHEGCAFEKMHDTDKHWCSSPPIGMEPGPAGARFGGPERPDGMTA